MLSKLEDSAKSDPLHEATLLMKVKNQREKIELIKDPDEFKKLIDAVDILLTEIEVLLQQQSGIFFISTKKILIPTDIFRSFHFCLFFIHFSF